MILNKVIWFLILSGTILVICGSLLTGEDVAVTNKAGESAAFDFARKVITSSRHDRIRQLGIDDIENDCPKLLMRSSLKNAFSVYPGITMVSVNEKQKHIIRRHLAEQQKDQGLYDKLTLVEIGNMNRTSDHCYRTNYQP